MKPAVVRLTLVVAGALALVVCTGCRKREAFFTRPTPLPTQTTPSKLQPRPTKEATAALRRQAVDTVTAYLTALGEHQYDAAFALLSQASQAHTTQASFEEQAQQGMPLYDLSTAKASMQGNTARVDVQQLEDPATHGFQLTRERGVWKVVYRGGIPGQPYSE